MSKLKPLLLFCGLKCHFLIPLEAAVAKTAHSLSLLLSKQMQHTLSLTATTECFSCLKSTEFVVTLSKRRESAAFAWREEGRVSELFALPAERTELQVPY